MFCSNCGKNLSDQEKFCPVCGTPASRGDARTGQPPAEAPAPRTETAAAVKAPAAPPRKRRGLLAIPAAAVLIAAALFLLPGLFPTGEPEAAPDVAAELLGYVNQAEALRGGVSGQLAALSSDIGEDGENVDTALYVAGLRQRVQILETFLADLAALQEQANALVKLDAKLKSARDEYFSMLRDSRSAHMEILTFLADYQEFVDQVVCRRPLDVDYDSMTDYSEALGAWVEETRKGYGSISCPACMRSEWEHYIEILEYNAGIARKVEEAASHNDWLRFYSAQNMTARYNTVKSALHAKLMDCLEGESDHANRQQNIASSLAGEIRAYAELEPAERDAYEFKYIRTGEVWLDYDTVDTIYPSLYNTYDAFLIVKTGCVSGTGAILIEAEIPGLTQKYRETHRLDSSYQAICIKPPALTGELNLSAAKSAQISVNIYREDGSLLDAKTFPVNLKSRYDFEWYSDEYGTSTQDNILCLLTPESSAITKLRRKAIDEITDMTGSQMESFVGYQKANSRWNEYATTYLQAAGLMKALYDMGVRYNMDYFSISGSGQHILFPEDVIEQRSGLCIETSLVVASALQSAGMHVFLLFPPGHAQAAVEVWNRGDCAGEYFLIETTSLDKASMNKSRFVQNASGLLQGRPSTGVITYLDAGEWKDYLKNEVEYVVDCSDAQLLGMTSFAN